jgi:hypothetical protein
LRCTVISKNWSRVLDTACVGERRGEVYTAFWWENLRERDHLEDEGVDGRIILRWIFRI